jgi:hypothetical protein
LGYYFKGLPMAASIIVGEFILWKIYKKQLDKQKEAASKIEDEYEEE